MQVEIRDEPAQPDEDLRTDVFTPIVYERQDGWPVKEGAQRKLLSTLIQAPDIGGDFHAGIRDEADGRAIGAMEW